MNARPFQQLLLVIPILQALERQQPGLVMNEEQYAAVVRAADAVIAAMTAPTAQTEDVAA